MSDSSLKLSPTERHHMMSRWHSPNARQLCRDRLLTRLKQNHEMRSSIVDRMRKVNINDLDDDQEDDTITEDYVEQELQQIIRSEADMESMSSQEILELTQEVKHEFLEEQNKSWEGLQTKEDQLKSQKFLSALQFRHAVICPYCKTYEMQTIGGYLVCNYCSLRFETNLSIDQIIDRMYQILNYHSTTCRDQFPQYNMFQSNLVIFCDTCPLYQCIL